MLSSGQEASAIPDKVTFHLNVRWRRSKMWPDFLHSYNTPLQRLRRDLAQRRFVIPMKKSPVSIKRNLGHHVLYIKRDPETFDHSVVTKQTRSTSVDLESGTIY